MSELVLEKNNELPKSWIKVRLNDLCELIGGGTPSRNNPEYFGGNIIWLTPTEIPKNTIAKINDSKEKITDLGLKKSSARIIPKESVLLTSRASIGYVAIAGNDVTTNQGFTSFICHKPLFNYYLAYWLLGNKENIESEATGTTFKEISKSKLREMLIPLPPLNEQKRIVAKIEELFSHIDNTKQLLEKTKTILKQQRQSLLKLAFEGKLTEKWREGNHIDMNSEKKSLENLILFSKNGFTGKPNEIKKGIPRLGIETITRTNSIHVDETRHKFIEIPTSEIEVYRAKKGDLFVCRQNGNKNYVGKSAVFNDLIKPMIFSDSLIQLRPKTELIVPEYLAFFINSRQGRKQIEKFCSTTAGNYSINGTNLKKTIIAFPSLLEQKQIIIKIEEGFSLIENDEKIIDVSLRNMDTMRKSILKQAFEGKLVPQDPNDGSASILLEKIKQEKEKLQEKQKVIKSKPIKVRRMKNAK